MFSAFQETFSGLLVGVESNESRDEGNILENCLRFFGVAKVLPLLAIQTGFQLCIIANKAAAQFDQQWYFLVLTPDRGEVTELRECTRELLISFSAKIHIGAVVECADQIKSSSDVFVVLRVGRIMRSVMQSRLRLLRSYPAHATPCCNRGMIPCPARASRIPLHKIRKQLQVSKRCWNNIRTTIRYNTQAACLNYNRDLRNQKSKKFIKLCNASAEVHPELNRFENHWAIKRLAKDFYQGFHPDDFVSFDNDDNQPEAGPSNLQPLPVQRCIVDPDDNEGEDELELELEEELVVDKGKGKTKEKPLACKKCRCR
ncbi:hypothetical protein BDV98DRAFT_586008 [Pterulicium gracile]|uniref:Uncharacterized protein n=1 Tax=Pterulicium gracile TaxID=1884261 RepID=A0A5C3Q498_9AGAR|nr:hypothetical protein BDV98DRAFT_586008 [Pterula gracilis]